MNERLVFVFIFLKETCEGKYESGDLRSLDTNSARAGRQVGQLDFSFVVLEVEHRALHML